MTARTAADLLDIQPNTAALFYHKIRLVIDYHLSLEADELFDGEVELDESYFGGVRKGKRGRGAAGKTAVFGILKRNGKVYTIVLADTKQTTLTPVIKRNIKPDSFVYSNESPLTNNRPRVFKPYYNLKNLLISCINYYHIDALLKP